MHHRASSWPFALAFGMLAAVLPWLVTYPPLTDLPQHLAQIVSLEKVLGGHGEGLILTPWYYPNTLAYLPIYLFWQVLDPLDAGRAVLSLFLCTSVLASHALAVARSRPIPNWLIATPLVFNASLYWGFLPFLIGWPFFCLYLIVAEWPESHRKSAALMAIAVAIYFSHSLWFLMLNAWVLIVWLRKRALPGLRPLLPLLPAWGMAAAWYPSLAEKRSASVDTAPHWTSLPAERLWPDALADAAFGGVYGNLEVAILLMMGLWMAAAIFQNRKTLTRDSDQPMLVAGLAMFFAYVILPDKYMNTIVFNARWLSFSLALLLIALPAPRLHRVAQRALSVVGAASFLALWLTTCKAWIDFDREDTVGIGEVLAGIKREHLVLGLDFQRGSLNVKGLPTLHFFAYAEVLHGATLSFSFSEHYSGIVQYKGRRETGWKRGLLLEPGQARIAAVRHFDRVVMSGDDSQHDFWSQYLQLEPVGRNNGLWRLYRPRASAIDAE